MLENHLGLVDLLLGWQRTTWFSLLQRQKVAVLEDHTSQVLRKIPATREHDPFATPSHNTELLLLFTFLFIHAPR